MINYGYFRHRFDAHRDEKLNNFVDEIGLVGYAYYYTLLELYGAKINSQEDKNEAQIHIRVIANTWRKRVDSCYKVLTKLQLSDLLVVTFNDSTCIISIPNFLKYYGSYKKKTCVSLLNKTKQNKTKQNKKEKQDKPAKNPNKFVLDNFNFLNADTLRWIQNIGTKPAKRWLDEYSEDNLKTKIEDCYSYHLANGDRYKNPASGINTFLSRIPAHMRKPKTLFDRLQEIMPDDKHVERKLLDLNEVKKC